MGYEECSEPRHNNQWKEMQQALPTTLMAMLPSAEEVLMGHDDCSLMNPDIKITGWECSNQFKDTDGNAADSLPQIPQGSSTQVQCPFRYWRPDRQMRTGQSCDNTTL